jgi:hypothetical protein
VKRGNFLKTAHVEKEFLKIDDQGNLNMEGGLVD